MIINRQTILCDVKNCGEEYSIIENIALGAKPSFIKLPDMWKNFTGYKYIIPYLSSFYICPKHEVIVKIDGEDLE